MRKFGLMLGLACVLATPAYAYENFIPLGTGYSTEIDSIPDLNSKRDVVNLQTDIIETEIYRKERENKVRDSFLNRFVSDTESSGSDYSIDY